MNLKVLILAISFVATTGLPVLQNTDSTRAEALWDDSSQKANQAVEKTEPIKEADRMWKSSLESSDPYGDLHARGVPQSQGLWHKMRLESQRLRARLSQELRELRERLATAFSTYPTPPSSSSAAADAHVRDLLARRLREALRGCTRQLCSALARYSHGDEEGLRGMARALGDGERELAARLAEFQAEAWGLAGGQGDAAAALRTEVEAFGAGARGRAESLRAGLAGARSPGEGLSRHVEQFCRSEEEENRLFVGRIERQLEALGQGRSEGPGEVPSVSPSSIGSLGEDFSPKLDALLQDILQTLN